MRMKKNVFVIIGSASQNSSNRRLIDRIAELTADQLVLTIFEELHKIPPFDPVYAFDNTPSEVLAFRNAVEQADAVLFCTPEYIFSIPSRLKNALEWCVATMIFDGKPTGLITASANGELGHKELYLIMETFTPRLSDETNLLIQAIKGKIDQSGTITDAATAMAVQQFARAFVALVNTAPHAA